MQNWLHAWWQGVYNRHSLLHSRGVPDQEVNKRHLLTAPPRPEVCRTYNFGEFGSSEGQFFRQFLQPIVLANESVPWGQTDLSYLEPGRCVQDSGVLLP